MSETISVSFGWRLPDGQHLAVTFTARVVAYQEERDRWLIQLDTCQSALDSDLPKDIGAAIRSLPGQWVYVPDVARSGLTLPLKLGTLTGRPRYFHAADPRSGPGDPGQPGGTRDQRMNEPPTQHHIARDLRAAGVRRGGAVLVHSSLSSLGYVPGGAETVILGLLEALGPDGTLLMPALSYERVDAEHPFFDVLGTPSNIGAIPEAFRTRLGTLRSVNPTHSVCGAGPRAVELLKEHILDSTPCGPRSPFRLLASCGGQILFLGCGMRPNTSMHAIEELVEPPYLFGGSVTYQARLANGTETALVCRRHNFAGCQQRYERLAGLLQPGALRAGRVLQAEAQVVECGPMWEAALAALRRDPFYFVDRAMQRSDS
jgi:aminoglycoside 3-N-acetyltransferase